VTNARIVDVPVDLGAADRHLAVAARLLGDAEQDVLSDEARYSLAYDAAGNAITAALRAAGRRVTAGARAHVATFQEAKRLLGSEHVDLLREMSDARRIRNEIEYETRDVSGTEADALRAPARAVVDAATRFVDAIANGA
jgi:hypothetical protein